MEKFILLGGSSNPELTNEVAKYLGVGPAKIFCGNFSDGETRIEIEENIRGREVFILQSTCPPVNDNLMELLFIIDAAKRASARRIVAVIPYYGYARQDRKVKPRVPISARLVADLITVAGANRVIFMDLHSGQIQGYFNIPVDNIFAMPLLFKYIKEKFENKNLVIVSPDAGGVERARAFAKRLEASLAIIDKRRGDPNVAKAINIIGEVRGKKAIVLDDMIDTAGTLTEAANKLIDEGAAEVHACCTHPVLSGQAIERINSSPIKKIIVTNTIPLNSKALGCKKIIVLSIAELLGESIKRSYESQSVSSLFV